MIILVVANKEDHMDKLLTQAEVAERIRRPLATMRYWRYVGAGPRGPTSLGRILYRESDVESWIAEEFAKDQGHSSDAEAI
jgi:hypothetical protein